MVGLSAGGGRGGGGGKVREGLLAAGGGGGGAGRLGRAVPAREVLGGSGGTAGQGLSGGFEGLLPAFAVLFGWAAALGAAARTPGSCPGLPPEKKRDHTLHTGILSRLIGQNSTKNTIHLPSPVVTLSD